MNTEVFDNIDFIDIEQIASKLSNITESNTNINNKISNFLCMVVNILDIWDMNNGNKDWYKYLPTEFTDLQKQQIGAFFIKIEPLLISFRKQSKKTKGGSFPIKTVDSGSDSNSDNSNNKQQVSELIELVGTTSFLKQIETYLLSQQIPEEISSENTFSEISYLLSSLHTMDDKLMSLIGPSQFTSNTVLTTTKITTNSKITLLINTISDIYKSVAESMLLPTFYLYVPLVIFAAISDMMSPDVSIEYIIVSLSTIYEKYPYLFDLTCRTFVTLNMLVVPDKENIKISDKLSTISNLLFLIKMFSSEELQLGIVIETFKSLVNEINDNNIYIFNQIKGVTLKDIYKMILLLDTETEMKTEKDILCDQRIQEVLKQLEKNNCISQLLNILKLPITDTYCK